LFLLSSPVAVLPLLKFVHVTVGTTMDASGCIWINIHGWWINSCGYG